MPRPAFSCPEAMNFRELRKGEVHGDSSSTHSPLPMPLALSQPPYPVRPLVSAYTST
jgi:hypothetical protein